MSIGSSSWSLSEEDFHRIDAILQAFLYDSNARCTLLVDRTGQLVTTAGEKPDFDSVAFASLAAADFSANDQLASMIGETEFSSLFHQGEKESMYLADVARRVILVVLFDNKTTLGMVRIKTRTVVPKFVALFEELVARGPAGRLMQFEQGWANEAENALDDLFNEP